jgi:thiol-disulfide isomerase/thioredoxin
MIWERLLVVLLLFLIGSGAYLALKQRHVRQLKRVTAVGGRPTLLYFGSDNCAACPTQDHHLQRVAEMWDGRIAIQRIDAEAEADKAARYNVFTLPTTMIMDETGVVQEVNYGLTNAHKLTRQLSRTQKAL